MSLNSAQRILAIEDDPVLGNHLHAFLSREGFEVTLCGDGSQGLALAKAYDFDLVLLDILLPGLNGLDVLQSLHRDKGTPIILLSALGEEQDRTTGFTYGADDYLPKPFSMTELNARINAVLRRVHLERRLARQQPPEQSEGPLYFSTRRNDARYAQAWLDLTDSEFRLLRLLWQYRGEVLDKRTLYRQVLRRDYSAGDRSLDMHVSHIRRKLQAIGYSAGRVETVRGAGYVLKRVTP